MVYTYLASVEYKATIFSVAIRSYTNTPKIRISIRHYIAIVIPKLLEPVFPLHPDPPIDIAELGVSEI